MDTSAGIFIDDAGTPGATSRSALLHNDRKSWAAVIVPNQAASKLSTALSIFLDGIGTDHGAKELHFAEIYGGRGVFEDVPIDKRYELMDLMAAIFANFQLPIFFQTCSPGFLSELRPKIGALPKIRFLDLEKHDHFALLLLLFQVRRFVTEHRQHFTDPLPVVVDEGLAKAGTTLEIPLWEDVFQSGQIEFRKSHECAFLQLADFAAFSISRAQWLLAGGNLKPRDVRFLEIVSARRLCIINLPSVEISPGSYTTAEYEKSLREDRLAKGLPDDPPSG
jgi:hypothetical protein